MPLPGDPPPVQPPTQAPNPAQAKALAYAAALQQSGESGPADTPANAQPTAPDAKSMEASLQRFIQNGGEISPEMADLVRRRQGLKGLDAVDAAIAEQAAIARNKAVSADGLNRGDDGLGMPIPDKTPSQSTAPPTSLERLADIAGGALSGPQAAAENILNVGLGEHVNTAYKPETIAGGIAQGVTQFTTGMLATAPLGALTNAATGLPKLASAVQIGATAGAAFDPTQGRLSNLIEQFPALHNPITGFLMAKDDDSEAMGRFKNALEQMGLGGALAPFASLMGKLKGALVETGGSPKALAEKLPEILSKPVQNEAPATISPTPKAEAPANNVPSDTATKGAVQHLADSFKDGYFDFNKSPNSPFNMAKMDSPEDIKGIIQGAADAIAPELSQKPVSFEETKAKAAQLADDPNELLAALQGDAKSMADLNARVTAAKGLMQGTAQDIHAEAQRLQLSQGTDTTQLKGLIQRMQNIQLALKPVISEAARTTSAGRIVQGGLDWVTKDIEPSLIQALVTSGGDIQTVRKIVSPPTSVVQEGLRGFANYTRLALLSSPATATKVAASGLLNTMLHPINRMLGGDAVGGAAEMVGMLSAINDAFHMAVYSTINNLSYIDPHFSPSAAMAGSSPLQNMWSRLSTLFTNASTSFLAGSHEFPKQLSYRGQVWANALQEGLQSGVPLEQLPEYMQKRFDASFSPSGAALDADALRGARDVTFTTPLNDSIAKTIQQATYKHPFLQLLDQFPVNPVNILTQAAHYTPGVNILMKSYREDLQAGGARAAVARGKLVTGGALCTTIGSLVMQGKLTGQGPADPNKRKAMMDAGWRPNSYVAADGTTYDYRKVEPFSTVASTIANLFEIQGNLPKGDWDKHALAVGAAVAEAVKDKSYFMGTANFLDAITKPQEDFEKWFKGQAGALVPNAVKAVGSMLGYNDRYLRETNSILDGIRAKIPGLSETLPPKRDLLGEPLYSPIGSFGDILSPVVGVNDPHRSDPVRAELAQYGEHFKAPPRKAGNVDLTQFQNAKGQTAYDRLMELRQEPIFGGKDAHDVLADIIKSDQYQKLPKDSGQYETGRIKELDATLGKINHIALNKVMEEFPAVRQATMQDRLMQKAALTNSNPGDQVQQLMQRFQQFAQPAK